MQISKTEYVTYLKHPAWLWLKKNDKSKLPEVDTGLQAIFDTGHDFEQYAEEQFPQAVRLGFSDYGEYKTLPFRTEQALENGAKTIFQARFEYGDFTFICDVIDVVEAGVVDLYEIKSSTGARADHEYDLAFQLMVLEGCGFEVRNIAVIHVNNEYVRRGEIDASALCATTDVTEAVKARLDQTKIDAAKASEVASLKQCPDISPLLTGLGAFKEWLGIFKSLQPLPDGSIYELGSINAEAVELFESKGIATIDQIPNDLSVSKSIDRQLMAYKNGEPIIDNLRIKQFLDSLVFPLYFFDYETMSSLVPYFDGMSPYVQYPFQYSLHILDSPEAELRHEEYLHTDNSDPAVPLVNAMMSHFGNTGSVIAWNMGFEKGCNNTLAEFVPVATEFLADINNRMVDLMIPFSSNWYVDSDFCGSASIKNVLPVLVPELSYKTLGIQEGSAAQRLWMEAVLDGKRDGEKTQILDDLRQYCKLDTLAMVEIYKKLLVV